MRSEPLDPNNSLLEIDCGYQSIGVASYVEHDPVTRDDACRCVEPFDIGRARPVRPPHLAKPGIKRRFKRWLIPVPGTRLGELSRRPPGDNSHAQQIACAHFGYKPLTSPSMVRRNSAPAARRSLPPRIDDRNAGVCEIAGIAGDDGL